MPGSTVPSLIGVILLLLVGFLAIVAERRSAAARWFAVLNLLLAVTAALGATIVTMPESEGARALRYGRVTDAVAALAFVAFYLQLAALAGDTPHPLLQRLRRFLPVAVTLSISSAVLSLVTPYVIVGVEWHPGSGYLPLLGAAVPYIMVVLVLVGAWAVALLGAILRHGAPRQRREAKWIGVGVLLFDWFGLLLLGLVLPRFGLLTVGWSATSLACGSVVMLGGMVLTRQRELEQLESQRGSPRRIRESPSGSTSEPSCRACATCGAMLPAHVEMAHCPIDGGEIVAGADPWPGRTLDGRFTVERLLGAGGMGRVYRAKHLNLGTPIAIKLMNADLAADRRKVDRFAREARSAMRIRSPHVVMVYDLGELPPGIPFLTMEYIAGQSLAELLSHGRRLSQPSLALLGVQLAEGLAAAHAEGVIHRDLKPDNVLVYREGERDLAKIVDFGLAKILGEEIDGPELTTTVGRVFGTPAYLSPEQAAGRPADGRSDVYALGLILYRARAGHKVFHGSPLELLARHVSEPPPPLSNDPLDQLVLSLLVKDPAARPDARALIAAFGAYTDGSQRLTVLSPLSALSASTRVTPATPTIDESPS